ncbi:MAG: hypothetical protein LHW55_03535 [Candidatus Cloacimonetes bacterium]|nr:hypothetical protein [Candidatus Cloacimonadota bacterium]
MRGEKQGVKLALFLSFVEKKVAKKEMKYYVAFVGEEYRFETNLLLSA